MSSRRDQAILRREQLLDAALAVFAEKGVDGASVKDIARAAGVTSGLLYHYFESKDAVVATLLSERGFLPRLRELLADAADRPVTRVLPELMRDFDQMLADNAALVALFFGAADPQVRAALSELVAEGHHLLTGYLRARAAVGEVHPDRIDAAAAAVFAAVAVGRQTGSAIDVAALTDLALHGLVKTPRTEA